VTLVPDLLEAAGRAKTQGSSASRRTLGGHGWRGPCRHRAAPVADAPRGAVVRNGRRHSADGIVGVVHDRVSWCVRTGRLAASLGIGSWCRWQLRPTPLGAARAAAGGKVPTGEDRLLRPCPRLGRRGFAGRHPRDRHRLWPPCPWSRRCQYDLGRGVPLPADRRGRSSPRGVAPEVHSIEAARPVLPAGPADATSSSIHYPPAPNAALAPGHQVDRLGGGRHCRGVR
jgi:hypothetical protein